MVLTQGLFKLLSSPQIGEEFGDINELVCYPHKTGLENLLKEVIDEEDIDYDPYYFQILVVERDEDKIGNNIKTTLITKTRKAFSEYPLQEGGTIADRLPSKGVKVSEEFLPITTKDDNDCDKIISGNLAIYPTVRFLLQCRKLSQLIGITWLSQESFAQDIEYRKAYLAREIFFATNIKPDSYEPELNDIPWSDNEYTNYLIRPDSLSWQGLNLSLLFAGQVYMKEGESYLPISESILSTYELVYEYGLNVSWDTFYASRTDYAQPGFNASPPYYEVTIGYPPRPELSEFTVKEDDLKKWVNAPEEGGEIPFYGENGSGELKYPYPPYPFIPMSCC